MSLPNSSNSQTGEHFQALVIGMGGRPGVGTSTIARTIAETEHNTPWQVVQDIKADPDFTEFTHDLDSLASFTNIIHYPLHKALLLHGAPPQTQDEHDHSTLQAYHEEVRRAGRGAEIIDKLSGFMGTIVLVEKIRHPADVVRLQERGGYFIFADAPEAVTDDRFLSALENGKHHGEPHSLTRAAELARAKRELSPEPNDVHASDILATRMIADEVVDFTGSIEDTVRVVQRAICKLGLDYLSSHELPGYKPMERASSTLITSTHDEWPN